MESSAAIESQFLKELENLSSSLNPKPSSSSSDNNSFKLQSKTANQKDSSIALPKQSLNSRQNKNIMPVSDLSVTPFPSKASNKSSENKLLISANNSNNILNNFLMQSNQQSIQPKKDQLLNSKGPELPDSSQTDILAALTAMDWRLSLSQQERLQVLMLLNQEILNAVPLEQRNDSRIQNMTKGMERQIFENSTSKNNYFSTLKIQLSEIQRKSQHIQKIREKTSQGVQSNELLSSGSQQSPRNINANLSGNNPNNLPMDSFIEAISGPPVVLSLTELEKNQVKDRIRQILPFYAKIEPLMRTLGQLGGSQEIEKLRKLSAIKKVIEYQIEGFNFDRYTLSVEVATNLYPVLNRYYGYGEQLMKQNSLMVDSKGAFPFKNYQPQPQANRNISGDANVRPSNQPQNQHIANIQPSQLKPGLKNIAANIRPNTFNKTSPGASSPSFINSKQAFQQNSIQKQAHLRQQMYLTNLHQQQLIESNLKGGNLPISNESFLKNNLVNRNFMINESSNMIQNIPYTNSGIFLPIEKKIEITQDFSDEEESDFDYALKESDKIPGKNTYSKSSSKRKFEDEEKVSEIPSKKRSNIKRRSQLDFNSEPTLNEHLLSPIPNIPEKNSTNTTNKRKRSTAEDETLEIDAGGLVKKRSSDKNSPTSSTTSCKSDVLFKSPNDFLTLQGELQKLSRKYKLTSSVIEMDSLDSPYSPPQYNKTGKVLIFCKLPHAKSRYIFRISSRMEYELILNETDHPNGEDSLDALNKFFSQKGNTCCGIEDFEILDNGSDDSDIFERDLNNFSREKGVGATGNKTLITDIVKFAHEKLQHQLKSNA